MKHWWIILALLATGCAAQPSAAPAAPTQSAALLVSPTPTTAPPTESPSLTNTPTSTLPAPLPSKTASPTAPALPSLPPVAVSAPFNGQEYAWLPFVAGLERPVSLAAAGDGSGRLFVVEQAGRIRLVQGGAVLPEPFLDITTRVGSSGNEQGLLGLAFHPRYAENGYFYVNYTDLNGDTVIARFTAAQPAASAADPASEKILLQVRQPYANHNGGEVTFGPDGMLYLGLGDGGSGGDPEGNGQDTGSLLGKILCIDVDGGDPYAIPSGNPFASSGGAAEVWALGLRNPWRFSFDSLTGDLYIADVGQNAWEEIDFLPAGSLPGVNFGWNYREGTHLFEGNPPAGLELVEPVVEYSHSAGCSVSGGYVYRGAALPGLQGVYLYGDYCSGTVWALSRDASGSWQNVELFATQANISSFGLDEAGEVYLVNLAGEVYRLGLP